MAMKPRVGDTVTRHGYTYEWMPNGRWGIVWKGSALRQLKKLYGSGMTLRQVADRMSTPTHTISHSVVHGVVNRLGIMRSHYGEAERQREYVAVNASKIYRAFELGASLDTVASYTGVSPEWFIYLHKQWMVNTDKDRLDTRVCRLTYKQVYSWNRLLTCAVPEDYRRYKRLTYQLSNLVLVRFDIRMERKLGHTDIDHIFSVKAAFDRRLPLSTVSHPVNLQQLPSSVNASKLDSCWISEEALLDAASKNPLKRISYERGVRAIFQRARLDPHK